MSKEIDVWIIPPNHTHVKDLKRLSKIEDSERTWRDLNTCFHDWRVALFDPLKDKSAAYLKEGDQVIKAKLTVEIPEPKIELTPSQLAEIVPKCAYQMRGPVDDIYVKVSDLVGHLFGEDEDEI